MPFSSLHTKDTQRFNKGEQENELPLKLCFEFPILKENKWMQFVYNSLANEFTGRCLTSMLPFSG